MDAQIWDAGTKHADTKHADTKMDVGTDVAGRIEAADSSAADSSTAKDGSPTTTVDAGTKDDGHYACRMSPWRYACRKKMLTVVRAETPILARMQDAVRRPWLDTYFAVSANMGTHTFYMVMLPVFFWYGNPALGREVIWVLALGVYVSGYVKDLLCLPRPQSPPLHRISMSGMAVLEYGLPSTHTANAVSVALVLRTFYPTSSAIAWTNAWLLLTLVTGRLYNGMHGFLDILTGALCGLVASGLRYFIVACTDENRSLVGRSVITAVMLLAIAVNPEPVDNCPCFDDSVAFVGTIIGMVWSLAMPTPANLHFNAAQFHTATIVYAAALARFVVGATIVVLWRSLSKRVLVRVLPPIWRAIAKIGIKNPRRYFLPASDYTRVPSNLPDDSVPDSPQQIAKILRNVRQSHGRSVSMGPQSEVDVYELLAQHRSEKVNLDHVEEPRLRYDIEVVMRLLSYGGIGPMVVLVSPIVFTLLGI